MSDQKNEMSNGLDPFQVSGIVWVPGGQNLHPPKGGKTVSPLRIFERVHLCSEPVTVDKNIFSTLT